MLLNQLTETERQVVLVLDDLHAIENAAIHAKLATLVEHLPSNARIVVSTRSDPALPLARLRARGELIEIRVADLRMTGDETAAYLNDVMGLSLSPTDTATLEHRTEGWIAALQLAVISLQGRTDPSTFIAGFAGSGRFVVDYLVEEVSQRLPDDVRDFLMRTCVLRRLNASLCDAITGHAGTSRVLLDRWSGRICSSSLSTRTGSGSAITTRSPMYSTRTCRPSNGRSLPAIHRRASEWYEQHGERAEAIHHALAAGDFEWAAELLERFVPEMRRNRQEGLSCLDGANTRRGDTRRPPWHWAMSALVSLGTFEGIEDHLRDAEARLDGQDERIAPSCG